MADYERNHVIDMVLHPFDTMFEKFRRFHSLVPIPSRAKARGAERVIWIIIATFVIIPTLFQLFFQNTMIERRNVLAMHGSDIAAFAIIVLIPYVFDMVFGAFPFEALRISSLSGDQRLKYFDLQEEIKFAENKHVSSPSFAKELVIEDDLDEIMLFGSLISDHIGANGENNTVSITIEQAATLHERAENRRFDAVNSTPEALLKLQAAYSRNLAKTVFTRAGVYLMVGAITAFSGLIFFYLQGNIIKASPTLIENLVLLAPRFGILISIEVIAFFFLKQYKSAMDEFRYFETISRIREEMRFSYGVHKFSKENLSVLEAVKAGSFSSRIAPLENGQTTEVLEARKIEGSELAGLAKIIEGIAALKK